MIKQDPVASEQTIGLAIVHGLVERVDLRTSVRTLGAERCRFSLGRLDDFTKHLATAGLVDAGRFGFIELASRFEHVERSGTGCLGGVGGGIERDTHVRLGTEVVDLVGLAIEDQVGEVLAVGEVAVM